MMKKRCCSLLLCACLAVGMAPMSLAAEVQPGYTAQKADGVASGTCGDNVTWVLDDSGTLTISGTGAIWGCSYQDTSQPWYDVKSQILNIVIEDGITNIGQYCFQSCSNVKKVTLPDSITRIAQYAFQNCESMQNINLSDNITSIGERAFSGCTSWRPTTLPNQLTHLESGVLSGTGVEQITIPDSVGYIGEYAFAGCKSLKEIVLPNSVTDVGDMAFQGCENLKKAVLSDHMTKISENMFYNCSLEDGVTIPSSVQEIGENAFYYTKMPEFTVPASITTIGNNAFAHSGLQKAVIPDTVTKIGDCLFQACDLLEEVDIPSNLPVQKYMFQGCISLKEITIPEGVNEIKRNSFWNSGLEVISWPSTLEIIEYGAFSGCNDLKEIYYNGSQAMLDQIYIGDSNEPLYNADIYLAMPFDDVPMDSYYAQPVIWAYQNEITSGMDETHFGPNGRCTRAQVVMFLWSAAGKPEIDADIAFTDVKPGCWYEKAVKWAVSEGITAGTSETTFSPEETCTRGQVVTFLWSAEGKPEVDRDLAFRDVKPGSWYEQAVKWAVSEGITAGTSETTFSPQDTCTRAQVVTFLYKDLAV
ncbi:leucine-rich repeat protein [Butyricicoccus sp.]|uniref:leucine-rich repeat protein n=1 Tax=Butyricicoccus sp. TaxID=2049021 RepID=UPI003F15AE3E